MKYIQNSSNFGINVYIFDKKSDITEIQNKIDDVYKLQRFNQFGSERSVFLFKHGAYNLELPLGFYTSVYGLGKSPDDVNITGKSIYSESFHRNNNSTCNFWRSVENLSVTPESGSMKWAVSQACPFRRVHVKSDLILHQNRGWASGGFIADSIIDGVIDAGSQQQWYSRNSMCKSWRGQSWNMVFQGVTGTPEGEWPEKAFTIEPKTPLVREKPYLYIKDNGEFSVFVPALKSNTTGPSWTKSDTEGVSLPITDFHIVREDIDNANTINQALNSGKNLIVTPGYYKLESAIVVDRPETIILGLGFATFVPVNGNNAMNISDVEGITVAGILFEAGEKPSSILLQVGEIGCSNSSNLKPGFLYDLVFRVGGYKVGSTETALQINSSNIIGDHFWIWRADHGLENSVGWELNRSDYGLIVNGDNVVIYGLFVEHFQKYNTLWNGENGKTFFYQCELAYDVPNQESWMDGDIKGFAAYKVNNSVKSHFAIGLGVYSVFKLPDIQLESAISVPEKEGIYFKNMVILNLNRGIDNIKHIINNMGESVGENGNISSRVVNYGEYKKSIPN